MKTRILHTKIWKDEFIANLTPTEKLLFIYYITNERVNIIHCYEITDREVMFDTGIDRGIIEAFRGKVRGKIAFKDNYVFLINSNRYETYRGDRNDTAKDKLLHELPKHILDWYNNILDRGIDTSLIGTINHKSEIRNHKSENNIDYLQNFSIEDFSDIDASEKQIRLEGEKAYNYCQSKGKTYKNYKAFLRNWVLKVYKKRKVQEPVIKVEYDPSGIARVAEMKKELLSKIKTIN